MKLYLAAGLQEVLVNHPELEVVSVVQGTHLVQAVQLARAVVVEDAVEGARVPVEVELVVPEAVHVHQGQDLLVALGSVQLPKPRQYSGLKSPPHYLQGNRRLFNEE